MEGQWLTPVSEWGPCHHTWPSAGTDKKSQKPLQTKGNFDVASASVPPIQRSSETSLRRSGYAPHTPLMLLQDTFKYNGGTVEQMEQSHIYQDFLEFRGATD